MANRLSLSIAILCTLTVGAAAQERTSSTPSPTSARGVFLHHSTGECIWNGGVAEWFESYNTEHRTKYVMEERAFPNESPYGWENFPYDYWNIWVRHAGSRPYKEEPTLEMLTKQYDVVVFKHCFPVSNIEADTGTADVASPDKRIENYKLQYAALKAKMKSFPRVRFLVWTGAAQVAADVDPSSARRAREFFEWVVGEWDEPRDNVYVWDFYELETGGGLYLTPDFASGDAHPNEEFSKRAAPLFAQRLIDVIQGRGDSGPRTGGTLPAAAVALPPHENSPQPTVPVAPVAAAAGKKVWVFEDGEDPARLEALWDPMLVLYVAERSRQAVRIDFAAAEQEDWGDYGLHRVVFTRPPEASWDVSEFRYLALRVHSSAVARVVLSLRTLPDLEADRFQPHFAYGANFETSAGQWKWIVLDLSRLELAIEGGEEVYTAAGRPERIMQLTMLSLALSEARARDEFLIDDITFLQTLPPALKQYLPAE